MTTMDPHTTDRDPGDDFVSIFEMLDRKLSLIESRLDTIESKLDILYPQSFF